MKYEDAIASDNAAAKLFFHRAMNSDVTLNLAIEI